MEDEASGAARFRASAEIDFPKIDAYFESIIESIATHDMQVIRKGPCCRVVSDFGTAQLEALPGQLLLTVETDDRAALNRMKYALYGPISFIAARENPVIVWSGDDTGLTPLDDLRVVQVKETAQLTPHMRRIVFSGADLGRFDRIDQLHCRLIFQPKGTRVPEWPGLDANGHIIWPEGRKLDTRVYTIRAIDAAKGEVTIDFVLHAHAGPATRWAMAAAPGDVIGMVGPAANGLEPAAFYVFAGDETALPGIARMMAALDRSATGHAFIEVDGPDDVQKLDCPPGISLNWLFRSGAPAGTTTQLQEAVRAVIWPSDLSSAFFWGGCEHKAFRKIHRLLRHERGLPRDRMVLYSHWHRLLSEEQIIEEGASAYLPD
ncbi:siderophore-interacting protein [Martelella mangrovi]|uniref:NADPH-dependent ferric siderophore reductase n=1 Tax=Martelella mangrovi TaxID=1397477 RepID=A0ABV2IBH7_9HYPH